MRMILLAGLLAWPAATPGPQTDPRAATPPVARKDTRTTQLHGETRSDDYGWLREKANPAVIAHIEAENAYAAAVLKPLEARAEALYRELRGRIKEADLDVPYRLGDCLYYTRTEEGKQYPIYARKRGTLDADEQVLLDLNKLSEGEKFFRIGAFVVSDDGNLLAYSTDTTGFRQYTLHVKDLRTGEVRPDRAEKVEQVEWAADNATLFYVVEDAAKRPYRLLRHTLGGDAGDDPTVYEERDELYTLGIDRARDRKYLFARSQSKTTSEVRALESARPAAPPRVLLPRREGHEYEVEHGGHQFYIRTNLDAKNFRIVAAPEDDPSPSRWVEFQPHRPAVNVTQLDVFRDFAVVTEREGGLPQLRVYGLADGSRATPGERVRFPEPAYTVMGDRNPEFDTSTYRLRYQSMITPNSVYDCNLADRTLSLRKRTEVLGGYAPDRYTAEWTHATAGDGVEIPISLVRRKDVPLDGSAPLLLYGYGSYGMAMPVGFSPDRLSLLDRGMIYAQAHIRGGGENGEPWHDAGKMMAKRTTFTDFIAVADALVLRKYTAHDRMAIRGGSAGGLLMGAVINFRPDLARVAVLDVPFVDVINTMLDTSLPLTVQEFLEWGNPQEPAAYAYMKTYCPYTNLARTNYPAMMVRTSLNDSQVMYWEPVKYVAKLRTLKTDDNPLLLKVNMAAGHGGASGRFEAQREQALVYAFVLDQLGITR